ncbi:M20/M25/M40 family metallo-hydrolase [Sphingosinicella sp. LY1275]|uniref:M20/M25/M40 family metallo-hydrolase n=1 Tax=Sphingosinicella sp. LY1275 TaxID=3095379 RepID=UPI002ADEAB6D|nr:M20/M25/M40 family metallo-hydrolase [Sphingosinicella sp. LY1275]MEA1013383.1 M20/M25/M40 family metallo-hydrolase [Sphingosinicella sp. LY1275]
MHRLLLAALPLLVALPAEARADPVTPDQLRRHIEVLASDTFEGRQPGTGGESKTLVYIATQLRALGLEPATGNRDWYQPVPLVERAPFAHRALWNAAGVPVALDQEDLILVGRGPQEALLDAPVHFVGHGLASQTAGIDLRGGIALLLQAQPLTAPAPSYGERARALVEAGAAAVIAVYADDVPWSAVTDQFAHGGTRLQSETVPRIAGAMPAAAAQRLVEAAGRAFDPVRAEPAVARASIEVSSRVRAYESHNLVARLAGSGKSRESVLILAHWDHLGLCGPAGAVDRICNGAVDNASGIAMLIEAARGLARGDRPKRDILFLATTAEELGLLGAAHFAAEPTVPLGSIVAAINLDTVAIAPKGEPVAVIGRGNAPLDAAIAKSVENAGRRLDTDGEADIMVRRQDGWALAKQGVPTVMVGGSFSDMERLTAFLRGPYHAPDDDLAREIVLDGAAEDTDLLIGLARRLADPKRYKPSQR